MQKGVNSKLMAPIHLLKKKKKKCFVVLKFIT